MVFLTKSKYLEEAIAQFVDESIVRPNSVKDRVGLITRTCYGFQKPKSFSSYVKTSWSWIPKNKAGQENMTAGVAL